MFVILIFEYIKFNKYKINLIYHEQDILKNLYGNLVVMIAWSWLWVSIGADVWLMVVKRAVASADGD